MDKKIDSDQIYNLISETYRQNQIVTFATFKENVKINATLKGIPMPTDSEIRSAAKKRKINFVDEYTGHTIPNTLSTESSDADDVIHLVSKTGKHYTRRKKKNGTRGTNDGDRINTRQGFIIEYYKNNPSMERNEFYEKVADYIEAQGHDHPSPSTIDRDIRAIKKKDNGITISFKKKERSNNIQDYYHLSIFGEYIGFYIRQIRIRCNIEKIIHKREDFKGITKKKYLSKFESIRNPDTALSPTKLCTFSFIFNESGYEDLLATAFDKSTDYPKKFLYIETHMYCTKIVFEYQHLEAMLDMVYAIIDNIPYDTK